jgi:hypothetical protein
MSAAPEKLAVLRQLLATRFPAEAPAARPALPTGVPAIDETAGGGLPLGALSEIVCAAPSAGSALLVARLLELTRTRRTRVALVDAGDAFDPASHTADTLHHLVWVRCRRTAEALPAADLVVRDANLTLVVLDLRGLPAADLRRTPATTWYRLQRAVAQSGVALVTLTPCVAVASAQLRFVLDRPYDLAALDQPREFLAAALSATLQRRRHQPHAEQEAV